MKFLQRLFGLFGNAGQAAASAGDDPPRAGTIQFFDQFGRALSVSREQWRTKWLPEILKQEWESPQGLRNVIEMALHDGFHSEVVRAAKHLYTIDPEWREGVEVWALTLMGEKRFKEAERALQRYLSKHKADGYLLTSLAKTQKQLGNERWMDTLWRALEAEPNQDNGSTWYVALATENGGEQAREEALQRIAALPGSWRATGSSRSAAKRHWRYTRRVWRGLVIPLPRMR